MLKSYVLGLLTFLIVDTLWIRNMVLPLYTKYVPKILALGQKGIEARTTPAILFYLIFYSLLYYFVVTKGDNLKEAACTGALLGLMTYTTYSLTNHTIMKQWNWVISISDILWGGVICSLVATVIHLTGAK